ncbi:MAG: hypothetical protein ACI810_001476 [Gammaproteobacteria bacterium]
MQTRLPFDQLSLNDECKGLLIITDTKAGSVSFLAICHVTFLTKQRLPV